MSDEYEFVVRDDDVTKQKDTHDSTGMFTLPSQDKVSHPVVYTVLGLLSTDTYTIVSNAVLLTIISLPVRMLTDTFSQFIIITFSISLLISVLARVGVAYIIHPHCETRDVVKWFSFNTSVHLVVYLLLVYAFAM